MIFDRLRRAMAMLIRHGASKSQHVGKKF